jgi:thioesterase domain-containing protein
LSDLFRSAVAAGRTEKGFQLLRLAADLRPTFTSPADLARPLVPVRLADGPARPRLVFISTPMATGGVHQHARLVSHLDGAWHVSSVPLPGFLPGENLPATPRAAVGVLADCVLRAADGEPFVLLGYSSGGSLAYSVAHHFETATDIRPAGLVMMDSFKVDTEGVPIEQLANGLYEKESTFGGFDGARLSGMAAWGDVMFGLTFGPIAAPVLFVQSTEPFFPVDDPADRRWQAEPWDPAHAVRTVPANHFTMVEDHAADTAEAIRHWLADLT